MAAKKRAKAKLRQPTTGLRASDELLLRADIEVARLEREHPGAKYSRHSVMLAVLDRELPPLPDDMSGLSPELRQRLMTLNKQQA